MGKYKMTEAELHRLNRMIETADRTFAVAQEPEHKEDPYIFLGLKEGVNFFPHKDDGPDYVYEYSSKVIKDEAVIEKAKVFSMPNLGPEFSQETEPKPVTMPSFDYVPRERIAITASRGRILPAA